ncbi:hypothetical protein KM043_017541 [Ampulex compressa]|nr:hypothetical protein KM043_017541 [Ampulex compressa]
MASTSLMVRTLMEDNTTTTALMTGDIEDIDVIKLEGLKLELKIRKLRTDGNKVKLKKLLKAVVAQDHKDEDDDNDTTIMNRKVDREKEDEKTDEADERAAVYVVNASHDAVATKEEVRFVI